MHSFPVTYYQQQATPRFTIGTSTDFDTVILKWIKAGVFIIVLPIVYTSYGRRIEPSIISILPCDCCVGCLRGWSRIGDKIMFKLNGSNNVKQGTVVSRMAHVQMRVRQTVKLLFVGTTYEIEH